MPVDLPYLSVYKPNKAVVEFDPVEFRRAILAKGQEVTWEMAAKCPCTEKIDTQGREGDLGHSQAGCPECKNHPGVIYHSAQESFMLVANISKNPQKYNMPAEMAQGAAAFTALPEHRPHFLDRLTLVRSVMPYHEVRERLANVEQPRYPIVTREVAVRGTEHPAKPVTKELDVLLIRKADSAGRIVPGALVKGTDYNVVDGAVEWVSGSGAPLVGQRYAISYYSHPRYVVREFPHAVRDTWISKKQQEPVHIEMATMVYAWLEFLGTPGWPS